MEIRTLRAFVEVVRQGGFSRAAKVVFATQSTVSKAVRQIEDEIGVPLIDRSSQHIALTAAGEIVFRRAQRILAEREDLFAELDELKGLKRGTLRLGLPPVGSSTLFAPLFARYRSRFPGIDIQLEEHGSQRLEEMLRGGEIELAASLLPMADEFEMQEVSREPIVALLAAGDPLAGSGSLPFAALKDRPFLMFESGFALNRVIMDACRRQRFEPEIAARSSQIDFIAELAAVGLGVGFLPRMIAEQRASASVSLVPIVEPAIYWHIAMIWRRGGFLSHAASAWLALVRETYPAGADAGSRSTPTE